MVFDLFNPLWNWDEPDLKNIAIRTSYAKEKTKAKGAIGRGDSNYKAPVNPVDALTHIVLYREQKLAGFPANPLDFTEIEAQKDRIKDQSPNTWNVILGQKYDDKLNQQSVQKPAPTLKAEVNSGFLVAGIVAFIFLFIMMRLKK